MPADAQLATVDATALDCAVDRARSTLAQAKLTLEQDQNGTGSTSTGSTSTGSTSTGSGSTGAGSAGAGSTAATDGSVPARSPVVFFTATPVDRAGGCRSRPRSGRCRRPSAGRRGTVHCGR